MVETVLRADGTTARFDGGRLELVRGRTTWTIPARALRAAELTAAGDVRIEINGPAERAEHGLGESFELKAPNRTAAQAFATQVADACAANEPAGNGHALVRVVTEPEPAGHRPSAKVVVLALLAVAYPAALVVLGLVSPLDAGETALTLVAGGGALLFGGILLWRMGRRARSLVLLGRRGIGVVGEITGYEKIATEGATLFFSRMAFTTVDGRSMTNVLSVVSASDNSLSGPVELVYDPERPERASRPNNGWFVLRTALNTGLGLVALGFALSGFASNLP